MIPNLPTYIEVVFGLTTVATVLLFIWTIRNSNSERIRKLSIPIIIGLILWLAIQTILTRNNVYSTDTDSLPPKIMLFGILPAFFTILFLFTTQKGRLFIDGLPLENITYLNIVRIPVEIVLYWLFIYKTIPELMTFEGRNFDIIAGISAPMIAYWGFAKAKLNKQIILVWNFIGLGLVLNIVLNAFFSAPSPLQKFAFDQPNIAILYFPFIWLPTCVVPIIIFGHLTSIRQLMKKN